ncbi:MAG: hypothetical protein H6700_10410 [Myxococcales bacterium]|nr:hypothetical protein [Myxococcales bacterium]
MTAPAPPAVPSRPTQPAANPGSDQWASGTPARPAAPAQDYAPVGGLRPPGFVAPEAESDESESCRLYREEFRRTHRTEAGTRIDCPR